LLRSATTVVQVMSNDPKQKTDPSQSIIYQIRLECQLDDQWADRFDGMSITLEDNGDTLLAGPIADQPALFGLLKKIRDLGMPLISVDRLESQSKITIVEKGEIRMNSSANATKKLNTKVLLSTLWIIVMINMLKADILSLYIPGVTEEVVKTSNSTGVSIPQLMLGGAIMMEISIVMIILSRVLKNRINRWVNIIASIITIIFVVVPRASYPHYTFIMTVEVLCLLFILSTAWKWSSSEE